MCSGLTSGSVIGESLLWDSYMGTSVQTRSEACKYALSNVLVHFLDRTEERTVHFISLVSK